MVQLEFSLDIWLQLQLFKTFIQILEQFSRQDACKREGCGVLSKREREGCRVLLPEFEISIMWAQAHEQHKNKYFESLTFFYL